MPGDHIKLWAPSHLKQDITTTEYDGRKFLRNPIFSSYDFVPKETYHNTLAGKIDSWKSSYGVMKKVGHKYDGFYAVNITI